MHFVFNILVLALICLGVNACLPNHLRKYQEPVAPAAKSSQSVDDIALVGKQGDRHEVNAPSTSTSLPVSQAAAPTIVAVEKNTYQFQLPDEQVWDGLINALLKNYNLTLVDKEQGLVTTEWDSYQLNGVIYRNKVSARLSRTNRKGCELTIHNNVEALAEQPAQQSLWLPGDDGQDEPFRIVSNIAILLRQPPPQAPPGNIAKGALPPELTLP